MTIYPHQSANARKTWIIMSVFLVFVIAVCWVFAQAMQSSAILYGAVIFAFAMNIAGYWYSDKLVLAMTRAREVKKQDAPELYRIVANLAITAGLPMPGVFFVNDPAPNPFP